MKRSPVFVWIGLFSWFMAAIMVWVSLRAWTRLNNYHAPALAASMQSRASPRLNNQVVLLIVEGMGRADVEQLPTLRWLARAGGEWQVRLPEAWWPPASWATILTGADPRTHSRLFTQQTGPLNADNLLAAGARQALAAQVIADPPFASLVSTWQTSSALEGLPKQLDPGGSPLIVVHLPIGDDANRRHLDQLLAQIVAHADLSHSALLVVGMGKPYRHPGLMPTDPVLVAVGAGILPGVRGTCDLRDVGVTAADLLGLPRPTLATGRSLLIPTSSTTPTTGTAANAPTSVGTASHPTPPPGADAGAPLLARITTWYHNLPAGLSDRGFSAGPAAALFVMFLLLVLWQPVRWAAFGLALRWFALAPLAIWLMTGQWPWVILGPVHGQFGWPWARQLILPMLLTACIVSAWSGLRLGARRNAGFVRTSLVLGNWTLATLLSLAATLLAWLYGSDFTTTLPPTSILWLFFLCLWGSVAVLLGSALALPVGMVAAGWAAHRAEQHESRDEPASEERTNRAPGSGKVISLQGRRRPPSHPS